MGRRAIEKLSVGYARKFVPIKNLITGERLDASLFLATTSLSHLSFAEITLTSEPYDWIESHIRAFEYLGGAPDRITLHPSDPNISPSGTQSLYSGRGYREMFKHYSVSGYRTAKIAPNGTIGSPRRVIERWLLRGLRRETFSSISEANFALHRLLEQLNGAFRLRWADPLGSGEFAYSTLTPLPAVRYHFAQWKKASVHIDGHIEIDGHFYSVPYLYTGRKIDVRISAASIECFYQQESIARHARASDGRAGHTTLAEHLASQHRASTLWNPGRFLTWAVAIGPYTRNFVRKMLDSRKFPELSYRSCLGLLSLSKSYSPQRLEAACQRALVLGLFRQASVRAILERDLDFQPLPLSARAEQAVTQRLDRRL